MKELFEYIDSFYSSDPEYYQFLMTIMQQIDQESQLRLLALIQQADNQGKKVNINEQSLEGNWDAITFSDLEIK